MQVAKREPWIRIRLAHRMLEMREGVLGQVRIRLAHFMLELRGVQLCPWVRIKLAHCELELILMEG